ncbi:MAG: hypothetical protein V2A79_01715 [Planctomycetota bacterium]
MKRLLITTLVLFTLVLPPARLWADEAAPDVLAVAPADAWGVICVRQMGEMDKKLNTLVQQLNLPSPFPNPISMGLSMLGFVSGVDATGGVGLVFLPAPSFQAVRDRIVVLIPTKDLKELLSLMEPEEVEPGISKVILQNQPLFAAQKTAHAVLSPSLDAVKAVLASTASVRSKLNPYQAKHYEKDDLLLWINAEGVTTSGPFKMLAPMLQMMNVDPAMLTGLRTLAVSLRITPAGLGFGFFADAIPGSDADKTMSSQKGTTESLLLGLPKDRYVLGYGGMSSKEASEMGAGMLAKILDHPQIQALQLDPAKLAQLKDMLLARVKLLRTLSVGIWGLSEGPDGLVASAKVVGLDGDPKEGLALFAELVTLIKGGLIPDPKAASMLAGLEYKVGAETLNGVSVDHLSFDLAKAFGEEAQKAWVQEAVGVISKILGKDALLVRAGVVDANHIVMTFGGGAERFKAVAALVKAKQSPLAEDGGIQRVRAQLPTTRNAEAYLAVDQLLNVINAIAKAADQPIPPLSLGELNAPLALGTEPVEKGGSQSELFVPMELVVAVKDLAMNMMGGSGDRPGGPGAPATRPSGAVPGEKPEGKPNP